MKSENPWAQIETPPVQNKFSARRIPGDKSDQWGLYWGVDANRSSLLILQLNSKINYSCRLPQLKGLSVDKFETELGGGERIVIRLIEEEQQDIFLQFCDDVVNATRLAQSTSQALDRFLARTWRWHRLLRSGRDGRLTAEEQLGLIGELRVIEICLNENIDTSETVESWIGPLDSPKDFSFGFTEIESKVHSPQKQEIRISSGDQLHVGDKGRLFLVVAKVVKATGNSDDAITITDLASRVKTTVASMDESAIITFEERLASTGFDWDTDYSDQHWVVADEAYYEVVDEFPKITPSMVSSSIDNIRYTINLAACVSYQINLDTIVKSIVGTKHED